MASDPEGNFKIIKKQIPNEKRAQQKFKTIQLKFHEIYFIKLKQIEQNSKKK